MMRRALAALVAAGLSCAVKSQPADGPPVCQASTGACPSADIEAISSEEADAQATAVELVQLRVNLSAHGDRSQVRRQDGCIGGHIHKTIYCIESWCPGELSKYWPSEEQWKGTFDLEDRCDTEWVFYEACCFWMWDEDHYECSSRGEMPPCYNPGMLAPVPTPAPEPYMGPPSPEPYMGPPSPEPYMGPPSPEPYMGPPSPEPYMGPPSPEPMGEPEPEPEDCEDGSCAVFADPHVSGFDAHGRGVPGYLAALLQENACTRSRPVDVNMYKTGDIWIVKNEHLQVQGRLVLSEEFVPDRAALGSLALAGQVLRGNKLILQPMSGNITWNGRVFSTVNETGGLFQFSSRPGPEPDTRIMEGKLPGKVQLMVVRFKRHLDVKITVPKALGAVDGLCGNFNGVEEDDGEDNIQKRMGSASVTAEDLLFTEP